MRCPICESTDKWKNVDQYRIKPQEMSLCGGCGFISYPKKYKTKKEIVEYYKKEYRPQAPKIGNLHTGATKLNYHAAFLGETLNEWKKAKREKINVSEVGCSLGLWLNWVRGIFPEGKYQGVDLQPQFQNVAKRKFNIDIVDEFDPTQKYDLIGSYKSLEHILDPDIELESYISALKDDGYLYIGVPIWFESMSNFGLGGFDIEFYYHPDHINTWTMKHFKGLIAACGGEIVKENHTYYDSVFLIKKGKIKERSEAFENPSEIEQKLAKVFQADELFKLNKFDEALKVWPKYPHAILAFYEYSRKNFDAQGFEAIQAFIDEKMEACPDTSELYLMAADLCYRYGHHEKSIHYCNELTKLRPYCGPGMSITVKNLISLAEKCKNEQDSIKYYNKAAEVSVIWARTNPASINEATNLELYCLSRIPKKWQPQQ
eukprot:GHVU01063793.1.p1 GENE.GHVU01063793.1~~GHVU01063793.1.p1  ORF type:complete len:431 (+),score=21.63 GHVU01063793.1:3076-4368(+)